jgi:hypothetical protein
MRPRWVTDPANPRSNSNGLRPIKRVLSWGLLWTVLALALLAIAGAAHAQSPTQPGTLISGTIPDTPSEVDSDSPARRNAPASNARIAVDGQTSAALGVAATTPIGAGDSGWDAHWLWGSLALAPLLLVVLAWLRDRLSPGWAPGFLHSDSLR